MTTDPKAQLPDEVEKALDFLHSYAQFNHRALIHRDNLRAHIAAQAEKIAKLEEQLNFERAQLLEWYNVKTPRCVDTNAGRIYGSHQAVDYVWDVICKYRALNGGKQ